MISVCCCGINDKWDVGCFVDCLAYHNFDTEFEVCFVHDNRVNDGGTEYYRMLSKKYPWFRVVEHTKQDTVDWLEWLLDFYRKNDRFCPAFIDHLQGNLDLFKEDKLFNPSQSFLWISSGILYNKAASIARGDYLLVTPSDFLFLFGLKRLEDYLKGRTTYGFMYTKPNAIWARVSNSPDWWLKEKMEEAHKIVDAPWNSKLNSAQRDYLCYPSRPEDLHLVDFRNDQLINFADKDFLPKMKKYTQECFNNPGDQAIAPPFHGVHVISRHSYKALGGFTEEYYGRAYADDKMTRRGIAHADVIRINVPQALPTEFSIAWVGQGEYLPDRFTYRTKEESAALLPQMDKYIDRHPIPGRTGHNHLHDKYPDNTYLNQFSPMLAPFILQDSVRFTKDKW